MKNIPLNNAPLKQSGFSLIELLIASILGLFIIGGVITSFVGTKDSDRMRSAVSEMDSNARTALEIMRQNIAHAGYPSINNILIDKPFYSESDRETTNRVCSAGVTLNLSDASTPKAKQYTRDSSDTGRGDILTVVVLADNPCTDLEGNATCPDANINPDALVYSDCGGKVTRDRRASLCSTELMPDPREAKIYSTFYLGSGSSDKKRILYCQGNRGGAQPLVDNIEYLQFLYGVSNDDGTTIFLKADDVEANGQWSLVTSVQIGLLMRSSQKNLLKKDGKEKYILLDRNVKVTDRRRLYRTYTTTINLPNREKGALL
jgi:type IV pilus assembly protein PilW